VTDNHEPLVSVVVVQTRNNVWVDECIESIEAQTYPRIEFILVDNRDRKMSIGKAFNTGISKSNGDYVAFVGDDDILHPQYIGTAMHYRGDYDLIHQRCAIFDESSNLMGYLDANSADIWKRSSLEKLGGYNENIKSMVEQEIEYRASKMNMTRVQIDVYTYGKRYHNSGHVSEWTSQLYRIFKRNFDEGRICVYKFKYPNLPEEYYDNIVDDSSNRVEVIT